MSVPPRYSLAKMLALRAQLPPPAPIKTPALDAALAWIAETFPDMDVTRPRSADAMPSFARQPRQPPANPFRRSRRS